MKPKTMRRLLFAVSLLLAATTFADVVNESDPVLRRQLDRARHMIVTPSRPLTDADRADLLKQGVEIQAPLTGDRYIARVIDVARVAGDLRVASIEPITAEAKLLASAKRAMTRTDKMSEVSVFFHSDVTFEDARKAVLAAGAVSDEVFGMKYGVTHRIDGMANRASITALVADDRVQVIGGHLPWKLVEDNATAALWSHVTELYSAPYGLSGAGQLVMVSELSDAQATHPEFGGRLVAGGPGDNGQHSTHVSGTIGASGIRPDAKGMAPNVQIREFNVGGSIVSNVNLLNTQLNALHPTANNTSLGFPLGWCEAADCGASKTVWLASDEYYGSYEPAYTKVFDDLSAQYGTLLVFSAGNDGQNPFFNGDPFAPHFHVNDEGDPDESKVWCASLNGSGSDCPANFCTGGCEPQLHHKNAPWDTMTITGNGKNVLAVGALQVPEPTAVIASFSSRGPSKDGRVKPDVVARGTSVLSTLPGSTYGRSSGTSMSAPVVTGVSAIVAEQWQKTFGARPAVAELRGVILAGTQDLGNPGPDYTFGYGIVNAKASADLIIADGGTRSQIANVLVSQNARIERNVTVTATQNLRVLVTWADPSVVLQGNDAFEAKALVNDLDVQVIGPDGTTYLPWVLDKVNYEAPATKGVNVVDNTELIDITNAAPGVYKVVILGKNVRSGGSQTAVVITNAKGVAVSPCSDVQEPNNSADAAFGNVPQGTLSGAICTAGDLDFFKFEATRFGPITATVKAGDTPLRVTLSAANGSTATVDVPANSTRQVSIQYGSGDAQAPALKVTVKVEATGTIGSNPSYQLDLDYGQFTGNRRRATRH